MPSPTHTDNHPPHELLERGRLALRALEYREKAARYKAEASQLQAAMLIAQQGDMAVLQKWLESNPLADSGSEMLPYPPEKMVGEAADVETATYQFDTGSQTTQTIRNAESSSVQVAATEELEKMERENVGSPPSENKARAESAESTIQSGQQDGDLKMESDWESMKLGAIERQAITPKVSTVKPIELVSDEKTADAIEESDQVCISDIDLEGKPSKRFVWWQAAHMWVSVALHAVVVVSLSVVVITAAQKPQLLSIVSSPVEADNVLMETTMETVTELETESVEPSMSTPSPSLSDVEMEVSLPTVPMEPGTLPKSPASVASDVAQSSSSAMQGISGTKMVSGASFFGAKATGNTFVFIVDSSPSMRRDGAFESAKTEILNSLASMKPKQRYFISFFGKEVDPLTFSGSEAEKYPVFATSENYKKTEEWIRRLQIQKEGWPPNDALEQAIAMQPDAIFMLFDGDTKVDVASFLRRKNRTDDILSESQPKVPIHVIHFFQEEFGKSMMQIAKENAGTYRFIPRPQRSAIGKR